MEDLIIQIQNLSEALKIEKNEALRAHYIRRIVALGQKWIDLFKDH